MSTQQALYKLEGRMSWLGDFRSWELPLACCCSQLLWFCAHMMQSSILFVLL